METTSGKNFKNEQTMRFVKGLISKLTKTNKEKWSRRDETLASFYTYSRIFIMIMRTVNFVAMRVHKKLALAKLVFWQINFF